MDGRYTCTLSYIFCCSIITWELDNINFGQRYNVFEEDGATTKTFDASYNETYTRIGAQSLSIKSQWQEFKVFIIGDEPEVIRGFYVGTCDRKEKFPEMSMWNWHWSGDVEVIIKWHTAFSFSAQFPYSDFWNGTGPRLPLDFSFPIPQSWKVCEMMACIGWGRRVTCHLAVFPTVILISFFVLVIWGIFTLYLWESENKYISQSIDVRMALEGHFSAQPRSSLAQCCYWRLCSAKSHNGTHLQRICLIIARVHYIPVASAVYITYLLGDVPKMQHLAMVK